MIALVTILLLAEPGLRVDTLRQGAPTSVQGLLVLQGQLYLDRGGGQLESLTGEVFTLETPELPLEILSDGLQLYARFSDRIERFSALGQPQETVLQGLFRSFAIQDGTALYALTWDGTDVIRVDFTGPEDLDLALFQPAQRIFALLPDGFALTFPDRTVLYDPYGFPLDSLPFPVTYITRLFPDLVYLQNDTLWISPQDTVVTRRVIAVSQWQDALYWLTEDGTLLRLRHAQ